MYALVAKHYVIMFFVHMWEKKRCFKKMDLFIWLFRYKYLIIIHIHCTRNEINKVAHDSF